MSVHRTTIDDLEAKCEALRAEAEDIQRECEMRVADVHERLRVFQSALEEFLRDGVEPPTPEETPPPDVVTPIYERQPAPYDSLSLPEDRVPEPKPLPTVARNDWARNLKGLTYQRALVRIAELSGGSITAPMARDILINAGVAKGSPKNVRITLHRLLSDSDEFEKAGDKGAFRLRRKAETFPLLDAQNA